MYVHVLGIPVLYSSHVNWLVSYNFFFFFCGGGGGGGILSWTLILFETDKVCQIHMYYVIDCSF